MKRNNADYINITVTQVGAGTQRTYGICANGTEQAMVPALVPLSNCEPIIFTKKKKIKDSYVMVKDERIEENIAKVKNGM